MLYSLYFILQRKKIMFQDIDMNNYQLEFELQWPYFLKDCLYEEISFELEERPVKFPGALRPIPKEEKVIIYKKLDNGISEEITLDELIYYIHIHVSDEIKNLREKRPSWSGWAFFTKIFCKIDNIKKAVENMKIILKYGTDEEESEEEEEEEEEEEDESPFIKEVSTKKFK